MNIATATETANRIRRGEITALEACDAAIERIERLDAAINAIVVRDFERARTAAKLLDGRLHELRQDNGRRPLLGVPMTVKESHDVAGLPSTWGLPSVPPAPAAADSVAVSRLKAAGAVILGKSNISTGLADWQANNPVYGRTVNPFDAGRSPGGSSGGAAAALAAGLVPLELGSDIGGSIRIPAHMCGVFGHKPTYGLVPMTGHALPGGSSGGGAPPALAVIGPMARNAGDLAVALDVLAAPPGGAANRPVLPPPKLGTLSGYRVLVLDSHPAATTDAAVRDPLNALAGALQQSGATVVRGLDDLPDLAAAHAHYRTMLIAITTQGQPGVPATEAHVWKELRNQQTRLARQWRDVFRTVDVVLSPPFGVPAFPHDDKPDWATRTLWIDGAETPYGPQVAWPGLATFAGLPATVAPIATTGTGLPVGVQIMGAAYADHTTIAFATLLEQESLEAARKRLD